MSTRKQRDPAKSNSGSGSCNSGITAAWPCANSIGVTTSPNLERFTEALHNLSVACRPAKEGLSRSEW